MDDDFVFEPTSWDFAVEIGLRVDPRTDGDALDELADAMLVSRDDRPELERLTREAVERIWSDDLETMVREGVAELGTQEEWRAAAAVTSAELDCDSGDADVSREVVRYLAMQLAQERTPLFFCLDCLEEQLGYVTGDEVRLVAVRAALASCRNVQIPIGDLRAAVSDPSAADRLGTPERRRAVRSQLGRIAALSQGSLPRLSSALRQIADERLPAAACVDDVWAVVIQQLLLEVAMPEAN